MTMPAGLVLRALPGIACTLLLSSPAVCLPAEQIADWPAESEREASNLSHLRKGFRKDLSGAVFNPVTRELWLCRNDPNDDGRVWVLEEDERGDLQFTGKRNSEWSGFGDIEGITFVDYDERVVFLIDEGQETIHEVALSIGGEWQSERVYDTSRYLPGKKSRGAEGITFIPDRSLHAAGFVGADGSPRVSQLGMGGLMFVGHQNGGGVHAFDLDRQTGEVDYVGEYRVRVADEGKSKHLSKTVALEFDRSTGRLYAWHGLRDANLLSELELASRTVAGKSFREFHRARVYRGPSDRRYEGMALAPNDGRDPVGRDLYLTVDDGRGHSLLRYQQFTLGSEDHSSLNGNGPPSAPDSPLFESRVKPVATAAKPAATAASDPDPWNMLFSVIGGLGIFLIGMKHLSDGMQAIAGHRLRTLINAVTDNRLLAVGVGTCATCLVQSSSITTVIVVGFVNSGLMQLSQAIGVIMGANIGTTITGWILVLKVGVYGLPILGVSAFFYLFSRKDRWRYIAMAAMGLGMIFFGLELMKNGVKPMRSVPSFQEAFAWFVADDYLGVLKCAALGCILTFLVQSSSATLGITISLAVTGAIPFQSAAALVLGENVGTTITAWLASLGATTAAKRAAYAHIAFNLIGVFWITLLFAPYIHLVGHVVYWQSGVDIFGAEFVPENEAIAFTTTVTFAIAAVHTGFNITNTLLFLGFVRKFARLLERWVPDRSTHTEAPRLSIDPRPLGSPVLSAGKSHAVIVQMADEVREMLDWTRELLSSDEPDASLADRVFEYEVKMDEVQTEVIEFLTNLLAAETPHEVAIEARQQLRTVDEYESVSDYVSKILKARLRLQDNGLNLCPSERDRMLELHDQVAKYVQLVTRGLEGPEGRDLARAQTDSMAITRSVKEMRSSHLNLLSEGSVNPIQSMSFSAMLNGYRKVKDHALNIAESLSSM